MADFWAHLFTEWRLCLRQGGLLLFFGLLGLLLGFATPSVRAQEQVALARQIAVLRDPSGLLEIAQVDALGPERWQAPPRDLNFGATRDTIWLRLDLAGILPERARLWLMRSNLEHVCLYSYLSGRWQSHCEGTREPLAESDFLSSDLVFRLASVSPRYYLKITSSNLIFLPLYLESSRSFQVKMQNKLMIDMMILGAILTTLLYHLLLYFRLKHSAYLYYVLFGLTSTLFFFGFLFGYIRLLPQNLHDLVRDSAFTLSMISSLFLLESMLGFVDFLHESPRSYKLVRVLQLLLLIFALLTLTGNVPLILLSVLLKTYLIPIVIIALLALRVKNGNQIARIYLLAWSVLSFSGWMISLMYQGILPYIPISTHLVSFGYVLAFLCFTMVLAEQLRRLNHEKAELLLDSLKLTQTHNYELELRVQRRTTELQTSLETVEALNQSKNRLFSILAHDLRSPFASLKLMMVLFEKKDTDPHKLETLLPRLRHQVDGIYASLENMLEWARTEMMGGTDAPERIELGLFLVEVQEMYAAAAHQKQITLEIVPGDVAWLRAQKNYLRLILRNLVNNAIKFTPAGGKVTLSLSHQAGELCLRVQDTGMGMTRAQIDSLFNADANRQPREGTDGERGIGLGLQLCQSYLEHMHARLLVSSEPGKGTLFEICFIEPD